MNRFQDLKKNVKRHYDAVTKLFDKAEAFASKAKNQKFLDFIEKEKVKHLKLLDKLEEQSKEMYPYFQRELKKRTASLKAKLEKAVKSRETLVSDNYLLEYKKKDLLILTNKLEEANDEISVKNRELMAQQGKIQDQAEKLNESHREILDKNEELERQKESLLDQSDYLHEANETITQMHRDLETQKNEILNKNQELLNLNNEKNNLIGIVAHDLKSPLNQIRGLLSIMKLTTENLSEETLGYINMMESSSGRLSDMIAKILDVEAIESQKLNLVIEPVNISELLSGLAERYHMAAANKSISVKTFIQGSVIGRVDRGYAEQVFENLLSNAIKFSPSDRNVFINLSMEKNKVVCEIKDEGPGLTELDKKKLFGKYQKLSARPTGDETSTGLGLSIVKKFVEAMDGEIWCESEAGKGASFFVAFPSV